MQVARVTRTVDAIFDRPGSGEMFEGEKGTIFDLPVAPDQAAALKKNLRAALVLTPKAPFYGSGTHAFGETTISKPP